MQKALRILIYLRELSLSIGEMKNQVITMNYKNRFCFKRRKAKSNQTIQTQLQIKNPNSIIETLGGINEKKEKKGAGDATMGGMKRITWGS